MTRLQRKDVYLLSFLFLVVLLIFYPVCFTEYAYTDEINQIWNYRPGSDYKMFSVQGRWITEWIVSNSFSAIDSIREITYIRICSLIMWLACIPVWYVIIKRVVANAAGYTWLPFFTCLFLVTSLQFSITVQWASCVELAIANTGGLLSGAIWYLGIRDKEKFWSIPVPAALGAVVAGLISLFAYQSGFGCFVIPFLFHYLSAYTIRKDAVFIKGVAFYMGMFALYFVLFKLSLAVAHLPSDPRSGVTDDVIGKIAFFLAKPLHRAFWFNIIMNDDAKWPWGLSRLLMVSWIALTFIRFGKKNRLLAVKHLVAAGTSMALSFMVSLVVRENYPSNRTMLGIDMCVFMMWAEMILFMVKKLQPRRVIGYTVALVFLVSGWYNFNRQFLNPVHKEYLAAKNFVQQHYTTRITTVHFIMPSEKAFESAFHIQKCMDEFGGPSTSFWWVPEFFAQQLVYEKTKNREVAAKLIVRSWKDATEFTQSGEPVTDSTLVVNMPQLIESLH